MVVATAMEAAVVAAVAEDTAAADMEVAAAATAVVEEDTAEADTKAPPASAHIRHLH